MPDENGLKAKGIDFLASIQKLFSLHSSGEIFVDQLKGTSVVKSSPDVMKKKYEFKYVKEEQKQEKKIKVEMQRLKSNVGLSGIIQRKELDELNMDSDNFNEVSLSC